MGDIVDAVVDTVGSVVGGVADAVGGVADAVGSVIEPVAAVASFIPGPWQIPAMAFNGINSLAHGNILGAAGSAFGLSGFGGAGSVVYDASGMAIDAASVASGATELAGGLAYSATGQVLGNAMDVASKAVASNSSGIFSGILPGESGGIPNGSGGSIFGMSPSSIGNVLKSAGSIYQAFNQPGVQAPKIAQAGADPYAPYRADAATQLNDLIQNPNKVYGMPGYQFAQQQGQKQIERAAASTGNLAGGGTLNALNQQGASTAQSWYDNYVNKLSMLSGANQSPFNGQQAYNAAQDATAQAKDARQTALLQGVQGLATSFFG